MFRNEAFQKTCNLRLLCDSFQEVSLSGIEN